MANRRISELQEQAGLQLDEDDLLTVVHVAEVDPAIKNKKLTISGTKAYLNVYYLPRTGGTISTSIFAMMQGVQILRVHDVNEVNQSIKVFKKLIK